MLLNSGSTRSDHRSGCCLDDPLLCATRQPPHAAMSGGSLLVQRPLRPLTPVCILYTVRRAALSGSGALPRLGQQGDRGSSASGGLKVAEQAEQAEQNVAGLQVGTQGRAKAARVLPCGLAATKQGVLAAQDNSAILVPAPRAGTKVRRLKLRRCNCRSNSHRLSRP